MQNNQGSQGWTNGNSPKSIASRVFNTMSDSTKDRFKAEADRLGAQLAKYEVTLKRGHLLECIAAVHGFRSWDHLCGSRSVTVAPVSAPSAAPAAPFALQPAEPVVPESAPMIPTASAPPKPRKNSSPASLPRSALALSDLANGPGHLAILGRPGAGKTTVLTEAIAFLRGAGKRVLGITVKSTPSHPTEKRCVEISGRADITHALESGAARNANIDLEVVPHAETAEWGEVAADVLRLASACVESRNVDCVAIDEVPMICSTADTAERFEDLVRLCRKQGVRVIAAGQRLPQNSVHCFVRILCLPLMLNALDGSHQAIRAGYDAQSQGLDGTPLSALPHLLLALAELRPVQRTPDGTKLEGILVHVEQDGARGAVGHVELAMAEPAA